MKKKISNRPSKTLPAPATTQAMPYIAPAAVATGVSSPPGEPLDNATEVIQQPMVTPPPKPGQTIVRHGSVAGKPGQIVTAANRWRENYNPLRQLTMRRVVELLELGQRGDYAYLQWAYHFCERRNPTLAGLVSRCEAPLMSFDWSIKLVSEVPEGMSEEVFKTKAEAQKQSLTDAYNMIDNLRHAIMHLHKADFRGYAHLQKHRNADGDVYHLETLDQWCICRDGLNGNWFWNPDSRSTSMPMQFLGMDYCIGGKKLPLSDFIIREVARPIDEVGIVNTARRALVEKDYDAFIEIYGIPGGVVIMPPGIPVGKEDEYEDSARKVAEGASGALPNGSDYKPNVLPRSQDPFTPRLENLDSSLVLAGTGGKLTMLTEHSAGQTRGNSRVHDETFGQIASGRAQNISEHFQKAFDQEILAKKHSGEPTLAYFSFGGEEEVDVDSLCNNVLALSQAGKSVNTAWLEEKIGFEFDEDLEGDPVAAAAEPAPAGTLPQTKGAPGPQRTGRPALPITKNRLTTGIDDVAQQVQAALAPILVRLKKINQIADPDSRKAALEKLAEDFPALRDVVLADHGVMRAVAANLAPQLGSTRRPPVARAEGRES